MIGAEGGLLKASTGYARQRIQQDSRAIAESLRRHGHPFDLPVSPARLRMFDAVLLDVVTRKPAQVHLAAAGRRLSS